MVFYVRVDVFSFNRIINVCIRFRDEYLKLNRLRAGFSYRIDSYIYLLSILELGLESNPLSCNCSSKWIQRQISKANGILGPIPEQITCLDEKSGKTLRLVNVTISGCGESLIEIEIYFYA